MDAKEAYRKKLNAQIGEWDAQINLLSAKLKNAGADANLAAATKLESLRNKKDEVMQKLKDLDSSTGEAWKEIQSTADKILDELKNGVTAALSKFK